MYHHKKSTLITSDRSRNFLPKLIISYHRVTTSPLVNAASSVIFSFRIFFVVDRGGLSSCYYECLSLCHHVSLRHMVVVLCIKNTCFMCDLRMKKLPRIQITRKNQTNNIFFPPTHFEQMFMKERMMTDQQ